MVTACTSAATLSLIIATFEELHVLQRQSEETGIAFAVRLKDEGSNRRSSNRLKAVRSEYTEKASKKPALGEPERVHVPVRLIARRWIPAEKGQEVTWAPDPAHGGPSQSGQDQKKAVGPDDGAGESVSAAFAAFAWPAWIARQPTDVFMALTKGQGSKSCGIGAVPRCIDPHPRMKGGSLWDFILTRAAGAEVYVHPSQQGPTKWDDRSLRARKAAFAAAGNGMAKKVAALREALKNEGRGARAHAREPLLQKKGPKRPPAPYPENLEHYGLVDQPRLEVHPVPVNLR